MKTINHHLTKSIGALLLAGLFALPNLAPAQPTAHYVPGSEGIKAASLPPPGLWARDYNSFYFADRINDSKGHEIDPADPTVYIYANVPRLLWITETKLLGGFLGVDALLPIAYKEIEITGPGGTFHENTTGIGDLFAEGSWSWHLKQWDLALAAGVWAPTGDFSENDPTRIGLGYWGEMLTAGATWYPDQEKRWALSLLNRYEFNQQQEQTQITPGQAWTLEGGLSYAITKTVDVGPIGYFQRQMTKDSGSNASSGQDSVAGIGPEISAFFPKWMLGVSLRYAYEVMSQDRLQGHTVTLTITKKL